MKHSVSTAISCLAAALLVQPVAAALDVDVNSVDSIKAGAALVAANLITYYKGDQYGETPGILPGPPPFGDYYWWEAGALWGTYIDYWHYTRDTTYSDLSESSMIFQSDKSFQPPNVTMSLGNDDQGFWGMSAMLAAETVFQNPPDTDPQWLELAQGVWNTQAAPDRHDSTCGGGLRWQITLTNNGYDYKNSIANGIFFNMGARLARYTGNDTYAQWAVETWDWMEDIGFMTTDYNIYDGAHTGDNCTDISKPQFSYNAAVFLQGAAFMYNYTNGSDVWRERVEGLLNRTTELFFSTGTVVEISCELDEKVQCNTDQLSFKGFLHRWMASAAQVAPFTHDRIVATLRTSVSMAINACTSDGVCGFRWNTGSYDNLTGAGQQMSMLGALSSLLVDQNWAIAPVTNVTGGTSRGDNSAGTTTTVSVISKADHAGAAILTVVVLCGFLGFLLWLLTDLSEQNSSFQTDMSAMFATATAFTSKGSLLRLVSSNKSAAKEKGPALQA